MKLAELSSPAVVYVVDTEDRFVFVNRSWERAFGLAQEQVAGRSIFKIFPAATAHAMAQQNDRVLESCAPLQGESTVRLGESERIYTTTMPLFDGGELPVAVCGPSVDITCRLSPACGTCRRTRQPRSA